jgi:hypothetical protein
VCKLTPDGAQLVFCTYFGTSDRLIIRDLAVDANHDIYVAAGRLSGSYAPSIAAAFNNQPKGQEDVVVAKIRADGSQVEWATYLGGSGSDANEPSIGVDGAGSPYVAFTTSSPDAPTLNAFQPTYGGGGDLYIARLNPSSGSLVWATFLGGARNESTETHEFAVTPNGDVYAAGPTKSADFPVTTGAFQDSFAGPSDGNDVFVTHLSPDGALVASTYLGGSGFDRAEGVAAGPDGTVSFTGVTSSSNFPVTSNAFQPALRGQRDAIVVRMPATLDRLIDSSLI